MPRRLPVLADRPAPSPLPDLYARWLSELFDTPLPSETRATCDDCAMLPAHGDDPGEHTFAPESKCCTYTPQLANFLVGRILRDRDPAALPGRRTVEQRIDAGAAVTPLGLEMPDGYRAAYTAAAESDEFGRVPSLRCPHYVEGASHNCGVWRNRSGVCATWFCKHVRGALGVDLWREGVLGVLLGVERVLSRWCARELGLDPSRSETDWGCWRGQERALYIQCAELVDPLSWKDVLAIGGVDLRVRARAARRLLAAHASPVVPSRLEAGGFHILDMAYDRVCVASYSAYDPLDLAAELLPLLQRFDGRPTRAVLREIEQRYGVELDEALVRRLSDFEILRKTGVDVGKA